MMEGSVFFWRRGGRVDQSLAKRLEKRLSRCLQFPFQTLRAITIAASPRLRTALVPAFPAIMCVLHSRQLEIPLPIGALFLQWCRAIANLHPADRIVLAQPGLLHVAQILALGDRALTQGSVLDCFQQVLFAAALHARPDQITHELYFTCSQGLLVSGTVPTASEPVRTTPVRINH